MLLVIHLSFVVTKPNNGPLTHWKHVFFLQLHFTFFMHLWCSNVTLLQYYSFAWKISTEISKQSARRTEPVVLSDRTRGSGHKLKLRRFLLNIRKHLVLTVRVTENWHRLPRESVESTSLELSRNHLNRVLGNWLQVSLLEHGLTTWPPEVP